MPEYVPLESLPRTVQDVAEEPLKPKDIQHRSSRWFTLEFTFYYLVLAISLVTVLTSAISFSSGILHSKGSAFKSELFACIESHPNFHLYSHKLSEGWMFGKRLVDNSDRQYSGFRRMLPLAFAMFSLYAIANQFIINRLLKHSQRTHLIVRALISVAGIVGIHGWNALKILTILVGGYAVGKFSAGRSYAQLTTWTFSILLLGLLEQGKWDWSWLGLGWLNRWTGIYQGWHVTFNISILRMISFNLDRHWSLTDQAKLISKHQTNCKDCEEGRDCERLRLIQPASPDSYNWFAYISYILYLPLFMAGPILSFNNFMSQLYKKTPQINFKYIALYGLRLLGSILTLEVLLHSMWIIAIKDANAWKGFNPLQFASLGLMNLFVVWLKLLIIWRFFRFFALCDGIEAPENMIRCIANNYSGFGFWRGWHRSFNLWIIRYMYIPMGGSATAAWNVFPIFTFVALWHDFELKMLIWGWLIAVFLIPELLAQLLAKRTGLDRHPKYRHYCACAGAANLLQVTICNMLGFALGLAGTKEMLRKLLTPDSLLFTLAILLAYYANVQVAFEVRESERRRGIFRNF